MCKRFVLASSARAIEKEVLADFTFPFHPFYNAHHGGHYPVICDDSVTTIQQLRWGLIPYWSKWKTDSYLINVFVAESVKHRAFRLPIRRQRCLVPVNCFYSWVQHGNSKRPHVVYLKDQRIFTLAGLYDVWRDRATGESIRSFAVLVNYANMRLSKFLRAMPVVISPSRRMKYLKADVPLNEVMGMLRPFESDQFNLYPVSRDVNDPFVDHKGLVMPKGEKLFADYVYSHQVKTLYKARTRVDAKENPGGKQLMIGES